MVRLVMHRRVQRTLFVADQNGALIGGSNMEFLAMPVKKLNHRSIIKVSAYDRSEMKKRIFIAKPNGDIEIERPAKKRARRNTDQVSCLQTTLTRLAVTYRQGKRSSCYGYFFLNEIYKNKFRFKLSSSCSFFFFFPSSSYL
jgi:hypothetical protein